MSYFEKKKKIFLCIDDNLAAIILKPFICYEKNASENVVC